MTILTAIININKQKTAKS